MLASSHDWSLLDPRPECGRRFPVSLRVLTLISGMRHVGRNFSQILKIISQRTHLIVQRGAILRTRPSESLQTLEPIIHYFYPLNKILVMIDEPRHDRTI